MKILDYMDKALLIMLSYIVRLYRRLVNLF
jgi:hypothetical protein